MNCEHQIEKRPSGASTENTVLVYQAASGVTITEVRTSSSIKTKGSPADYPLLDDASTSPWRFRRLLEFPTRYKDEVRLHSFTTAVLYSFNPCEVWSLHWSEM